MKHYYNNEDARNLINLEIENRKEALKLYDGIIEVVRKFDGKVLNKRLETALKKVDERLSCKREYKWFEIKFYCSDRSIKSTNVDSNNYSSWNYLTNSDFALNTYTETYSYTDRKSMLDNERIVANVLIEALWEGKENIENEITALENSLTRIEEWKVKLETLKKEIDDTMKQIPCAIRDYYDINYWVENR